MTDAKICGLTTPDSVEAALSAGARWIGFVNFPASPRHVDPRRAGELSALAAGRAATVAVTVNADDALLADIQRHLRPDWIQLHGSETPDRVEAARTYARRGIIKALPIAEAADLAAANAFDGVADMILFDAKPPRGASRPGGWGQGYDYSLLQSLALKTPWMLSGGINPGNVRAAVVASGATAVDVSSGVESAPGVKDKGLIEAFMRAVA